MSLKKGGKKAVLIGIVFISELTYWFIMLFTRCSLVKTYFSPDFHDTFMDYFNMLDVVKNGDPYALNAQYPAMCFVILRGLYHLMPLEALQIGSYDLRMYEPAWLGFILFEGISAGIFFLGIHLNLKKLKWNEWEKGLFFLTVFFSGPFLFTVERGNMILLAVSCSLMYMYLYDSDKKWKRIVSYFFLSLAASIKVYPALFGLMSVVRLFITHRTRKTTVDAIRELILFVIIGCLVFFLPFFAFNGLSSIKGMLHGMLSASSIQSNIGMNINFSMYNLAKIAVAYLTGGVHNNIANRSTFQLFALIIGVGLFVTSREEWKKWFSLVMLCLWIPTFSYTYTLLFLLLPLLSLLRETNSDLNSDITGSKKTRRWNIFYLLCFILIMIPYALPETSIDIPDAKFPLSYGTLIINLVLTVMSATIGIISLRRIALMYTRNHLKRLSHPSSRQN